MRTSSILSGRILSNVRTVPSGMNRDKMVVYIILCGDLRSELRKEVMAGWPNGKASVSGTEDLRVRVPS